MNESDNELVEGSAPLEVDPILDHLELEGGDGPGWDAVTGEGETGMEGGTVTVLDQTAVITSIESIHSDLQQANAQLGTINTAMAAMVFLTLFVWAERKVKNAVMKFTGGRKNASVD